MSLKQNNIGKERRQQKWKHQLILWVTLGQVLLATIDFSVFLASDIANAKFSGRKILIFPNYLMV